MGEIRKFLVTNKGGIEALAEETSILMEETASMRGFVSNTAPDESDKLLWDADVSDTASVMSVAGFDEIINDQPCTSELRCEEVELLRC
jgi:hypothetical protein